MIGLLKTLIELRPKRPVTRLSEAEAMALARGALPERVAAKMLIVRRVEQDAAGTIKWSFSTATVGSGYGITIDDQTGEASDIERWGFR